MNKKLVLLLIILSTQFNMILIAMLKLYYIHYLVMMSLLVYMLGNRLFKSNEVIKTKVSFYFKLYLISIIPSIIYTLLFSDVKINFTYESLASLIMVPLLAHLLSKYTKIDLQYLNKLIIVSGIITGFFGLYQFFIDPSLFGLYNISNYLVEKLIFRISGNLASSQIYGLFLVLSLIVCVETYRIKQVQIYIYISLFLGFSSLLSGNKSVLFLLVIYFISSIVIRSHVRKIKYMVLLLILIIMPSVLSEFIDNPILQRVVNRANILNNDYSTISRGEENGRLLKYNQNATVLFYNNEYLFFGQGVGKNSSQSRANNQDIVDSESYFFQIILEFGLLPLIVFIIMCYQIVKYFIKQKMIMQLMISVVAFSSFIFVHAFINAVFFPFWIIIFSKKQKDSNIY